MQASLRRPCCGHELRLLCHHLSLLHYKGTRRLRTAARLQPPHQGQPARLTRLARRRSMSRGRALSMAAPEANRGLKDATQRNKAIKMAGAPLTQREQRGFAGPG